METVNVKCPVTDDNPTGYYVINKEDFDKDKHELFFEPKAGPTEEELKAAAEAEAKAKAEAEAAVKAAEPKKK